MRRGTAGESDETISALCVVRCGLGIVLRVHHGAAVTDFTNAVKKE